MDSDPRAIPGTSKDPIVVDLSPDACDRPVPIKKLIGTGRSHASGGVKTSLHGTVYQIKLDMFYLGRLMNDFDFEMGTEVKEAASFDDLVFKFENNKEKGAVFLQAKHRQDESKTINEIDLTQDADGHFSLRKYYSSYCEILEAKYFKDFLNNANATFVISTNIDIADSLKKEFEETSVGKFANNGLFHPGPTAPNAKFYKVKQGAFYNKLVTLLEKDEIPMDMAEHVAKSVVIKKIMNNNKIQSIKIDDKFKRHREWLLDRIFDPDVDIFRNQNRHFVTFKKDFLSDTNEDLNNFKQAFIQAFRNERIKQNVTDDRIKPDLDGVKFQVPKDFTVGGRTKQNKAKEFINALIFAVNQPNEDKLGQIVEKEILPRDFAGLPDRKSVTSKLSTFITDWVKQEKGFFLLKKDIEEQFALWGQTNISHINVNELKRLGYKFQQDDVIVKISNFLKDGNEQITCLYYSEQLLTEIKLCQVLDSEGIINNEFIYSDINTLSEQVNKNMCPLKAFNSQFCHNVFIRMKKNSVVNQNEERLLRSFMNIVKKNIRDNEGFKLDQEAKAKKRMLMLIPVKHKTINESNNFFQNFDEEVNRCIIEDTKVNYSNLNIDSKQKLFEIGMLKILGNDIGAQLIPIFDDRSLPSIVSGLRNNFEFRDKTVKSHVKRFGRWLSGNIKDDVLARILSGDHELFKDIISNYDDITKIFSEKCLNDEVLSTVIHECTRADTSIPEKAISFFFYGASLISPLWWKHSLMTIKSKDSR